MGLCSAGSLTLRRRAARWEILILGRAVQGLGGALLKPGPGRLVMLRTVRAELVSAMAWLTIRLIGGGRPAAPAACEPPTRRQ